MPFFFGVSRKEPKKENNATSSTADARAQETSISQANTPVKSYVGALSSQPNQPYEINDLFNGKLDTVFKSRKEGDSEPSMRFYSQHTIFNAKYGENSKISAARLTALKGHGDKTTYLLEMGYSKKEVKLLAAQGQFSKAILGAFDAAELCSELIFHTKTNTQYFKNPNFNPNLFLENSCLDHPKTASFLP